MLQFGGLCLQLFRHSCIAERNEEFRDNAVVPGRMPTLWTAKVVLHPPRQTVGMEHMATPHRRHIMANSNSPTGHILLLNPSPLLLSVCLAREQEWRGDGLCRERGDPIQQGWQVQGFEGERRQRQRDRRNGRSSDRRVRTKRGNIYNKNVIIMTISITMMCTLVKWLLTCFIIPVFVTNVLWHEQQNTTNTRHSINQSTDLNEMVKRDVLRCFIYKNKNMFCGKRYLSHCCSLHGSVVAVT